MQERPHVRPRARLAGRTAVAALLLVLIVAEGADAGHLVPGIGIVVCGTAAVTALMVPKRRLWCAGSPAVGLSCVFSLACTWTAHRPPHTPGTVEICALLLLVTRGVRLLPLRTMVPLVAGACAAAMMVTLRVPAFEYWKLTRYVGPALVLGEVLVLVLGLYLRLLDSSRLREAQHRLQTQRLEHARDLHDFVAHHVTAIVAQTKAVRFTLAAGRPMPPEELDAVLAAVEDAGSRAVDSMRTMVGVLRGPLDGPDRTADRDLAALRELADELARGGPQVELSVEPALVAEGLPPLVAKAARHVVQESLTNVRKHAVGASRVRVWVHRTPRDPRQVVVSVSDDGGPIAPAEGEETAGFGLLGLTERVEALGGTLTAGGGSGTGWTVRAELPLRDAPAAPTAAARVPGPRTTVECGAP